MGGTTAALLAPTLLLLLRNLALLQLRVAPAAQPGAPPGTNEPKAPPSRPAQADQTNKKIIPDGHELAFLWPEHLRVLPPAPATPPQANREAQQTTAAEAELAAEAVKAEAEVEAETAEMQAVVEMADEAAEAEAEPAPPPLTRMPW